MASWPNIDDFLRSRGFTVYPHTSGQTTRACSGTSYHCDPPGSAADYGTAQYSVATLWSIFDALKPFALGGGRIVEELAFVDQAIDGGVQVGAWPNHGDHVHVALVPGRLLPIDGVDSTVAEMGPREGVDISEFQSSTPPGEFYYIRLLNEYGRQDYRWQQHHAAAAGRPRGAYGIISPGAIDPNVYADRFIGGLLSAPWELHPTVDIELGDANANRDYAAVVAGRLRAAGFSKVVGYYSRDSRYRVACQDLFDLQWIAAYGSPYPAGAHMHQFTSSPWDKDWTPDIGPFYRTAPTTKKRPRKNPDMYLVQTSDSRRYEVHENKVVKHDPADVYFQLAATGLPHAENVHPLVVVRLALDRGMSEDEINAKL